MRAFLALDHPGITLQDAVMLVGEFTPEHIDELREGVIKARRLERLFFKSDLMEVLTIQKAGEHRATRHYLTKWRRDWQREVDAITAVDDELTVWQKRRQRPVTVWERLKTLKNREQHGL